MSIHFHTPGRTSSGKFMTRYQQFQELIEETAIYWFNRGRGVEQELKKILGATEYATWLVANTTPEMTDREFVCIADKKLQEFHSPTA